uniref:Uncharacterized protein n=1 Tax=Oryza brachyantha TaxID=4533 RepID=J3MPL1_ORYBR
MESQAARRIDQNMATRKKEAVRMKHGTAQTKVNGDDEMLRTGFVDGTPLEGGKIADSHPVHLFPHHPPPSQSQQHPDDQKIIADSELFSDAGRVAQANNSQHKQA